MIKNNMAIIEEFYKLLLKPSIAGWLALLSIMLHPTYAETITIGKGSGLIWQGLSFSGALDKPLENPTRYYALASISSTNSSCGSEAIPMGTVSGFTGIKLANGVVLVPQVTVSGRFTLYHASEERTFSGSIGYPVNNVKTSDGKDMRFTYGGIGDYPWCFAPEGDNPPGIIQNYYSASAPRTVSFSGNWAIIADGSQTTSPSISLPVIYFGSYSSNVSANLYKQILPTNIDVRVSTLECTITTSKSINFGNVRRNSQPQSELGTGTYPLDTTCFQPTDMINANINIQFNALSGLYDAKPTRLSLKQGGGYITGEIDGVTGSGVCNATTGLKFDNTLYKVGEISNAETKKTTSHNVTWRLCSGGSNLPTGRVDASAEMLVTFN